MPKLRLFSEKEKEYIKSNYLKISSNDISKEIGCNVGTLRRYMKRNNLIVPKEVSIRFRADKLKGRTSFTEEQDNFLKENYLTMPVKSMGTEIKKSGSGINIRLKALGLKIPEEIIEQRKKDSQYSIGDEPMNKGKKQAEFMSQEAIERTKATRFSKGVIPHNTKYDGHERITKDGYIEVRIRVGKYRLKHIHNWEKLNGKLPSNHCLSCLDGNKLNTDPQNWELITRGELMLRNSHVNYPPQIVRVMALRSKLSKIIKNIEKNE